MRLSFLKNNPKGLPILAFGNGCDTFSYYGTQTIIALYLMHIFGFSQSSSYLLYGSFSALGYFMPIFGGFIGDRVMGSRNAVLLGGILGVLGNLLLMLPDYKIFSLGLSMTVIGSGLYKSNSTKMVGALYQTKEKEGGYTLLYLAVNLGGALSPIFYGLMIYRFGWEYGFLCSAIGIGLSLMGYLAYFKCWPSDSPNFPPQIKRLFPVLILLICGIMSFILGHSNWLTIFLILIFSAGLCFLAFHTLQLGKKERQAIVALLEINCFSVVYYTIGLQVGSTITLFIQHAIPSRLPASTFSMLYCAFVLILAPFFRLFWNILKKNGIVISTPVKLLLGVLLASLSMISFAWAARGETVLPAVLLGYLLLSAGELVMSPFIYTAISNLAPENLKGSMVGTWYLFVGLGSYFSGLLSRASDSFAQHYSKSNFYCSEFLFIAAFALGMSILLSLLIPSLKKWME